MVPRAHCGPSLALPPICPQGPSITASSNELCTAESSHLKGLSHKQQCPSKTREPDFPDRHQEGRSCICGRQPLTTPFQSRMVSGPRSAFVGKSNITDIYTLPFVWNDIRMALPEQQKHAYLQRGCYSQFHAVKQLCNSP